MKACLGNKRLFDMTSQKMKIKKTHRVECEKENERIILWAREKKNQSIESFLMYV